MRYRVGKSVISGLITAPPSKSHTLRALLFALMGEGKSVIRGYLKSPDTRAMIEAISLFGAKVEVFDDRIEVEGVGGKLERPQNIIDAGNSGLVFRFIAGIGSLLDSYVIITGDESIRTRRPITPLLEALGAQGVFATAAALNGHAPVIIKGPLRAGKIEIDGQDSQPVSAMLIATSFLEGSSEIVVTNPGERPWIDLTLKWLSDLGMEVINTDYIHYKVKGGGRIKGFDVQIPGDFSSAAYPIVASLITGGKLKILGLDLEDKQADKHLLTILQQMGAKISCLSDGIEVCGSSKLSGIKIDVNDCIDQIPLLAALGCFATSPLTITGGKIARFKESDRIAVIIDELKKMGAAIDEKEDGMIVYPSKLKGAELTSHKDHRIALSLITAAFAGEGESFIDGVECIDKTYASFVSDMLHLQGNIS